MEAFVVCYLLLLSCWTICFVNTHELTQGRCRTDFLECEHGENYRADSSSSCFEQLGLCDNVTECADGSDEKYCDFNYNFGFQGFVFYHFKGLCSDSYVMCLTGFHVPTSKICVSKDEICDGHNDCDDGSDEMFCPYDSVKGFQFTFIRNGCGKGYYMCPYYNDSNSNHTCINRSQICDGKQDCGDNSDEIFCPYIFSLSPRHLKSTENILSTTQYIDNKTTFTYPTQQTSTSTFETSSTTTEKSQLNSNNSSNDTTKLSTVFHTDQFFFALTIVNFIIMVIICLFLIYFYRHFIRTNRREYDNSHLQPLSHQNNWRFY